MSHQKPGTETPDSPTDKDPPSPFITDCHRNAVETLNMAFVEARPLVILTGEGKSGASFVISRFLSGVGDQAVMARIVDPPSNAIELMRELVNAIGFEPKEMSLTDLEQVFEMFLLYQQTHNRRTIVCVEETQDNGQWVLDRIRRLVESEIKSNSGLMVILSGRPSLNEMLEKPPLNSTCAMGAKRIVLAPFSIAETKEYIRRRVEGTGAVGIDQVFTFNAVTAIQEHSAGVPDEVADLCSKCLELADLEDNVPVTTAVVNRAAKLIRLASIVRDSDAIVEEIATSDESASRGNLIVYVNSVFDREQSLDGGHVLIGRDRVCDISLQGTAISRHHALVINSSLGVKILDLGSKNGTFVNGCRIRRHTLLNNDKITIGSCSIEYFAGDDQPSWIYADEPTETFETRIIEVAQPGNENGQSISTLDSTQTLKYQGVRQ